MFGVLFKPHLHQVIRLIVNTKPYAFDDSTDQWCLDNAKPRYRVGQECYIQEAWTPWADEETKESARRSMFQSRRDLAPVLYRLDYKEGCTSLSVGGDGTWHSPLFMPEKYARDLILFINVRPERLKKKPGTRWVDNPYVWRYEFWLVKMDGKELAK